MVSVDVKLHVYLLSRHSPAVNLKIEVEPGSRSELDRCLLLQVPTAGCPDSVFVTLPHSY